MSHLLFVDDEPDVLAALERLLAFDESWEVYTASSGEAALDLFEQHPIDVVVSDMRMPGMDGAELLRHVQVLHPRCIRIILSGHTDVEAARRAVPVAHQFLHKPCDAAVLEHVFGQVRDLRELLSNTGLQALIGSVRQLPARPSAYLALTEVLLDPAVSIRAVSDIVARDPVIASRVLHVANSAFFALQQETTSLETAIGHIGYTALHSLVAACELFSHTGEPEQWGVNDVDPYECAQLAMTIGRDLAVENAFVPTLLRDLGRLTMTTDGLTGTEAPVHAGIHTMERETWGFTHAEAGAYLLAVWGLPLSLVRGVLYHAEPLRAPQSFPSIAHVAWLAEALLRERRSAAAEADVDTFAAHADVVQHLPRWRARAAAMGEASNVGDAAA